MLRFPCRHWIYMVKPQGLTYSPLQLRSVENCHSPPCRPYTHRLSYVRTWLITSQRLEDRYQQGSEDICMTLEWKCTFLTLAPGSGPHKAIDSHTPPPNREGISPSSTFCHFAHFLGWTLHGLPRKEVKGQKEMESLVKYVVLLVYFAVSHSSDERVVIMLRSQMEAVTKKGSHTPL